MKLTIILALACSLAASGTPSNVGAQPALERLESQIRQRVGTPGNDNAPPATPARAQRGEPRGVGDVGYLGLTADDGRDRGRGARIMEVQGGGPAERAGLRPLDLITAIDGIRVRQISDMSEVLSRFAPGQTLDFDILRGDKRQKLQVILGERSVATQRRTDLQGAELPGGELSERVPLPPGELIPEPPLAQAPGPAIEPTKGSQPVISQSSRIDQLERRIDGLERRVRDLEKALKSRNKE